MADDTLIYGIGFNLEDGVEEIRQQWAQKNKELGELFTANFSINVDENSVNNFESIIRHLQNIDPINSETSESVKKLIAELVELERVIKSVDELNNQLQQSSSNTASQIEANTIKIAKAEQALAKAREASEKADLAAQKVETEREKTLLAESKALRELIKSEEEFERYQGRKQNQIVSVEDTRTVEEYQEQLKDLVFQLDFLKEKYEEISQVSPAATVGLGIPELVESLEGLDDTVVDSESWTKLEQALKSVDAAYTPVIEKWKENDELYQSVQAKINGYVDEQEQLVDSSKKVSDSLDSVSNSVVKLTPNIETTSEKAASSFAKLGEQAQNDARDLIYFQQQLADTKKELSELNNAYSSGKIGAEEYSFRQVELLSLQKEQTAQVNEYQKILALNVQLVNNEAGSYKALQAEQELVRISLRKLSADRNASIKDIENLTKRSRDLTLELEAQRVAQGKYALTAGTYGETIRDLTYFIRLYDPALGILVQRTQRISFLNTLWNKTNQLVRKSLNVTAKVATGIMLSGIALLSGAIYEIINRFKAWREEVAQINEINFTPFKEVASEVASLDILFNTLRTLNKETQLYADTKNKIISQYETYLRNLDEEKQKLNDVEGAYDAIKKRVVEVATLKGLEKQSEAAAESFNKVWEKEVSGLLSYFTNAFGEEQGYNLFLKFANGIRESGGVITKELEDIINNVIYNQKWGTLGLAFNVQVVDASRALQKENKKLKISQDLVTTAINNTNDAQTANRDLLREAKEHLAYLEKLDDYGSKEERAYINADIKAQKEYIKTLEELGTVTKSQKKDAISLLKEELDLIGSAYDKYKDLIDVVGEFNAAEIVKETYKSIIPDDKFVFSIDELRKSYDDVIRKLRSLGVSEADILKLKVKIDDRVFKQTQKELKDKFDALEKELNKKKVANTFFEKIVGATGDVSLATKLTLDLTGRQIENLRELLVKDIQEGFKGFGVEVEITPDFKIPEIQKEIDKLPKEQRASLQKILDELLQYDMDTIYGLYSNLSKYEEYEKRKNQIVLKGEEERRKIREQFSAFDAFKLTGASLKKQQEELAKLNFEELKAGGLWSTVFEDLEKAGVRSLDILIDKIEEFIATAGKDLPLKEYKELVKILENLKDEKQTRSLFSSIASSVKEYTDARQTLDAVERKHLPIIAAFDVRIKELKSSINDANTSDEERLRLQKELIKANAERSKSTEAVAKAESNVQKSGKKAASSANNLISKFKEIGETAQRTNALIVELGESLGWIDEEAKDTWEDIQSIINGIMEIAEGVGEFLFGDITDKINGVGKSVNGTLQAIIGVVNIVRRKKLKKINDEIKEQQEYVDELTYSYNKLMSARSKALGGDIAKSYADERDILLEQIEASEKLIELENKKKSKDRSADFIKEQENAIRDSYDRISELQREFAETLLESDVASAAKSFASSWLDAYLSFGNTKDAIIAEYKDMMKRLVINAVLGKAIEGIVESVFGDVEKLFDDNFNLNEDLLRQVLDGTDKFAENINSTLEILADSLNLREFLGDDIESSLTGISKAVAGITEETALTLGGYLGTLQYYSVGQFDVQSEIRDILKEYMMRTPANDDEDGVNAYSVLQSQMVSHLSQINAHTLSLDTTCKEIESMLRSVRTSGKSKSAYSLSVNA